MAISGAARRSTASTASSRSPTLSKSPSRDGAAISRRPAIISGTAAFFCFRPRSISTNWSGCAPTSSPPAAGHSTEASRDVDFIRLDKEAFAACPAESIDYAVMEHTARAAVVPVAMGWSDVGSWDALWEMSDKDAAGNALVGNVVAEDTRNCYLRSEPALVAALGVEDLVVVATADAVMLAPRNRTAGGHAAGRPARRRRPRRGRRRCRSCIARGAPTARCTTATASRSSTSSSSPAASCRCRCTITAPSIGSSSGHRQGRPRRRRDHAARGPVDLHPARHAHRLENPGKIPLHLIEVQSGSYLGEDDIVRFEDSYGRS